jgi:hypothetical protein
MAIGLKHLTAYFLRADMSARLSINIRCFNMKCENEQKKPIAEMWDGNILGETYYSPACVINP